MDITQIEKLVKEYVQTKSQKKNIDEKVSRLREKIIRIMQKDNKTTLKLNEYSVEVKPRITKSLNREKLYELVEKGILPKDLIHKETKSFQLYVESKKDITLEGNKFIIKRK